MKLQAAIDQLYRQCREFGHCAVLLDTQAGTPLPDSVARLDEGCVPRLFLRDPLFANAPTEAPMLLRVPAREFLLIEELATLAQKEATDPHRSLRSICAFIASDLSGVQLATRLARALDLRVEGRSFYFRYFDPRVFHHLPHLIAPPGLGCLLRGVAQWSYFLWDGSLLVRQIPECGPSMPDRPNLTIREWQMFETIEHFNATQRLFARQGLRFEPTQTLDLFGLVHAARSLGIRAPEDTAYYLACSHHLPEALSRHPAWPSVMELLAQEAPLADALAHLCGVSIARLAPHRSLQPEQMP